MVMTFNSNANSINNNRKEYKSRAKSLEYLIGIIEDLFYDWNKFKGEDVSTRRDAISNVISERDFNFNNLVNVIASGGK